MAYTTEAEVEKDGNSYETDDFTSAVAVADSWIDKITGDHYESTALTLTLDGSGNNLQSLLHSTLLKVISVTSIKLLDPRNTDYTYDATKPEYFVYAHYLRRYYDSEIWPTGFQNIQVIGTFGWSTVPGPIAQASTQLTRMILDPDSELDMSALSIRIGDLSFTRARYDNVDDSDMTGVPAVDRILRLYQNPALLAPEII